MTRAVGVAATLFLLAACSGGRSGGHAARTTTTPAPPVSVDDACRLLTVADAAKLFAEQPQRVDDSSRVRGAASACLYEAAGTSGQLLQFRIYTDGRYYARTVHPDARDVTGLGEQAFVSKAGPSGLVDCQFVKAGRVYSFAYSNLTHDPNAKADALVSLAREVAARA